MLYHFSYKRSRDRWTGDLSNGPWSVSGPFHWSVDLLRVLQSHFIFQINIGKRRIRLTTTLKLNGEFLDRLGIGWRFKFRVVLCRIRLLPTLISKIKWLWSELPLNRSDRSSNFPLELENHEKPIFKSWSSDKSRFLWGCNFLE